MNFFSKNTPRRRNPYGIYPYFMIKKLSHLVETAG